jgi:ATP-dependent Lon protease
MDPILKNRMNLIKVPGYSVNDKIQIINKFLIPQITKSLNMDTTKIIIKHINFVSLNLYKITNLEDFEHKKMEKVLFKN